MSRKIHRSLPMRGGRTVEVDSDIYHVCTGVPISQQNGDVTMVTYGQPDSTVISDGQVQTVPSPPLLSDEYEIKKMDGTYITLQRKY